MNNRKEKTFSDVRGEFITSQTAKGVADITIRNYHQILHNISKYLDIEMTLDILSKNKFDEMIVEMRKVGIAHNSIATYVRIVRTFLPNFSEIFFVRLAAFFWVINLED